MHKMKINLHGTKELMETSQEGVLIRKWLANILSEDQLDVFQRVARKVGSLHDTFQIAMWGQGSNAPKIAPC